MIGWMVLEERRGWRSTVEEVRLEGLRVCRAGIPAPAALSPAARNRRVKRGAQLLRKAGCRRCLTPPGFPFWDLLHESGLQAVDPGGLCQALAARLAGTYLAEHGVPETGATVSLLGSRVDRSLFDAACTLVPRVRRLVIRAGEEGRELAQWLEREYGIPVLENGRGAQVRLWFTPPEGETGPEDLVLCAPGLSLGGLELHPVRPIPDEVEVHAFAALLWEEGRLALEDIEISSSAAAQMT